MLTCAAPGCLRAPMTSPSGSLYSHCEAHTRRLLSDAFAPVERWPQAWTERAEAGTLPPLVVGGVPVMDAPLGAGVVPPAAPGSEPVAQAA